MMEFDQDKSYESMGNALGLVVWIFQEHSHVLVCSMTSVMLCNASTVSRSNPGSWTTAINIHLFLMRKLQPVLHGAITTTVILASATREISPWRSCCHYFCTQKSKGSLIIFGSACHVGRPSFVSHGKRVTSLKCATYSSGVLLCYLLKCRQLCVNKVTLCNSKSNTSVFAANTPHCYLVALMNRTVMTSS